MGHDSERLDGWKSIGAHLGRDRTTAIRWARDRGLPVRAVPGGKTRTVYALRSELDAWSRRETPAAQTEPERATASPLASPPPASSRWRGWVANALALIGVAGLSILVSRPAAAPLPVALPHDPAVAALYLRGRDEWARRDSAGLLSAMADLHRVTQRAPDFAPAYAALADVGLLMREFGSGSEERGYEQAEVAASRALRLDPELPAAWRALGFIAYWRDHDVPAAAHALHEALRRDAADPQTRFWIANILADNGEFAAAEGHYAAARLRDPGSLPIRIDQTWARWSAGHGDAEPELRAITRAHPDVAVSYECLSMIRLAAGDWPGYLVADEGRARLRAEPALMDRARGYRLALATGGVPALRRAVLADTLRRRDGPPGDAAVVAMILSAADDRTDLLHLLARADAEHRTWGWAGYRRRLAIRWRDDPVIAPLLARRTPPPMAGIIDAT